MNIHVLSDDERRAWEQALEPVYTETRTYISQELLDAVNELRQRHK